ncbi:biosynthetic-type acetolactate synthase large subunit [Geosporobacter ferrireducens]|uniref:Acetolactate synthase n=1 Tax=Geosporobacter ferrireducens TaxID=1424294 RepID=A0A1D8GDU4_9FIRM|nr:biosynthetic-type acetolactate synthase large subunit [Geosporobacter ferrireducens]AOT69071.1 acetolactate synthase, large subunit, biosynthetic type [Geosporobacter ferrireducens]MTI56743.1 biosynthetic-type acetolactate synthase large subunit [Geosporobacter ferrireducens]
MKCSGAEILLQCLKKQGVDTIFGYPGGAVIPLYDALYDYRDSFFHVLTCHEQGAVHAADGYARASGRVGVCFATSGPGATNTVTGIATAYADSVPLVVITGQVASSLLGRDSFQEVDITGITMPITKHSYMARNIEKLPEIVAEAFQIAASGRPGPVLIDIPKDVFMTQIEYTDEAVVLGKPQETKKDSVDIREAAEIVNQAQRPVIYSGGGIILSEAYEELLKLSEYGSIPVVNTLMGLGSFPRNHSLSLGMVGMHGFPEANLAVTHSDLVIAIGARFSDRVIGVVDQFAPKAKVIHIDADKVEIGKNKEVHLSLVGDVKEILKALIQKVEKKSRQAWLAEIGAWKRPIQSKYDTLTAKEILTTANRMTHPDTIVTTEVGQHQMWTAQYWKFQKPRTFLSSGGLGTMGYGLGAAIGAQTAYPDQRVLHMAGDGSFRMNCNELATVAKYNLPIITILFNNGVLGMVRQWQMHFCNERYSETDLASTVDYIKLADAYGIRGKRVENIGDFEKALQEALQECKPMLIECVISKDEHVFPIVPPGKPIHDYILE